MSDAQFLAANGLNGATGEYLLPELTPRQVAEQLKAAGLRKEQDDLHGLELRIRHQRDTHGEAALSFGLDAKDLAQTGWGVVFAHDAHPGVIEALRPLLDHRRPQAASHKDYFYRELTRDRGCRPDESKQAFLARHKVGNGMPANPEYFPYYLLLVGDPEKDIPFRFQYELDVEYAVGRLWFEKDGKPDLDAFASYARSVVEAETIPPLLQRRSVFFSVQNPDDRSTRISTEKLIGPLLIDLPLKEPKWDFRPVLDEAATKARLVQLLGGPETPALLFTASHGIGFPPGDARQRPHQGALVCQDWPGPRFKGRVPEKCYFAAEDVAADARLLGLIAVHFACYGAGTPRLNDFPHEWQLGRPPELAAQAFVAGLPQRLLGHPRGGALAVVGHVDLAWTYGFLLEDGQAQTQVFHSTLRQLLQEFPVGAAMEWFNQRYAALAAGLTTELNNVIYGRQLTDTLALRLVALWTGHNDARSYVILGDPAVRLHVTDSGVATRTILPQAGS
jgi:hypothetical protein